MAKQKKYIVPFVLNKPLTTEQIKDLSENGKVRIECMIYVSLAELMENDFESVLDVMSERVHESGGFSDFSYKAMGVEGDFIVMQLNGDVKPILELLEEDE